MGSSLIALAGNQFDEPDVEPSRLLSDRHTETDDFARGRRQRLVHALVKNRRNASRFKTTTS